MINIFDVSSDHRSCVGKKNVTIEQMTHNTFNDNRGVGKKEFISFLLWIKYTVLKAYTRLGSLTKEGHS